MRILGLSHRDSGCGFHRVVLPMAFMDDIHGYVTNVMSDEVLNEKWDIFFFNRISMWDNQFQNVRQTLGCKVIMDIDDSWILPTNHLNYYDYINHAPRIEKNLSEVDMVTDVGRGRARGRLALVYYGRLHRRRGATTMYVKFGEDVLQI